MDSEGEETTSHRAISGIPQPDLFCHNVVCLPAVQEIDEGHQDNYRMKVWPGFCFEAVPTEGKPTSNDLSISEILQLSSKHLASNAKTAYEFFGICLKTSQVDRCACSFSIVSAHWVQKPFEVVSRY